MNRGKLQIELAQGHFVFWVAHSVAGWPRWHIYCAVRFGRISVPNHSLCFSAWDAKIGSSGPELRVWSLKRFDADWTNYCAQAYCFTLPCRFRNQTDGEGPRFCWGVGFSYCNTLQQAMEYDGIISFETFLACLPSSWPTWPTAYCTIYIGEAIKAFDPFGSFWSHRPSWSATDFGMR